MAYLRRNGKVEQFAGYDTGVKKQTAVRFGANGCLAGYKLQF